MGRIASSLNLSVADMNLNVSVKFLPYTTWAGETLVSGSGVLQWAIIASMYLSVSKRPVGVQ